MGIQAVVIGSLNMDLTVRVAQLPAEGETLLAEASTELPGGKGGNQAAAIGKLGIATAMIAKVGADDYGDRLVASLQGSGVDISGVMVSDRSTGMAMITIDREGRNHIVVIPGANADLSCEDIESQRHLIEQCEIVVLQLEIPYETAVYALRLAKQLGKRTVLNPAPARELDAETLSLVDLLIPNEHELESITGVAPQDESHLLEAAGRLEAQGTKAMIVTLGAAGCALIRDGQLQTFAATRVQAVDTTAAGDSFIGGYVAEYLTTGDDERAIRFAMQAAAVTVTRHGAQQSLPSRAEVQALHGSANADADAPRG
ncbi:ribokinase [Paenibacillus sp. 1P07SE]|uniref:ribokinase n=1 Tax=Paenibacillus sp. 1P07SE TaxID=3132209 RepID=UPI0039A67584